MKEQKYLDLDVVAAAVRLVKASLLAKSLMKMAL
jgi:hypothetical protein